MNKQRSNPKKMTKKGRPNSKVVTGNAIHRGEKLKIRRLEMGLTQPALADLLRKKIPQDIDITILPYTISGWENGYDSKELSDDIIDLIYEIMGVSKEYFDEPLPDDESPISNTVPQRPESRDELAPHMIDLSSHMKARETEHYRLLEENSRKLQDKLFSEYIRDFIHLGNLEQHNHEELQKMTEDYVQKIKEISNALPSNTQILVYSCAQKDFLRKEYVRMTLIGEEISPLLNPIVFDIKGRRYREPFDEYWENEFKHLKLQFFQCIDDLRKSNTISTLYVFALAPQPLVVELGRLLKDIPNIEIINPYRLNNSEVTWGWKQSPLESEFQCHEAKTIHDDAVLNISLNTLIKKSVIERAIGQKDLSIWTLTLEEPDNECLKNRIQLHDFNIKLRYMLDEILKKHGKCSLLHVFLSVPIPIAFEIGRVWNPISDPALRIYGINSEFGNYFPIHTIAKD